MDPNNKDNPQNEPVETISTEDSSAIQESPADALSRTPDDLAEEQDAIKTESTNRDAGSDKPKKISKVRRLFKKINIYLLLFILVVIVSLIITLVFYLNSQKPPIVPTIADQELTEDALRDLASKDASVGGAAQTLTIQGNAVIDGQTLMRGNLNIAGNFQTGGSIQGPNLTISGTSNLGTTQINTLQIANTLAVQGGTTMRDLNVSGASTFSGPITASQITTSRLVLSGNASLEVPNHISFTGPAPGRTINNAALGGGGTASVSGSDTAGTVNVNTGNSPQAGCMIRLNFAQAFSKQPHVIISPVGNAAGRTQYYVDRDQAGFSICTAAPAPGNSAFAFDYFVTY